MLEQIIRQEGEDDNDYEVPDDETINQMIARSEEEFETFQVSRGQRNDGKAYEINLPIDVNYRTFHCKSLL